MFGTTTLGTGIDLEDITVVIHFDNPYNFGGFAQECGRAGRDGWYASSLVLDKDV